MSTTESCSATLNTNERRVLRQLLVKENQIVEKCNYNMCEFSKMLNELQCIRHTQDSDERALKYDEFIRQNASLDCDMTICDMVPEATQIALSCDCMCLQAACFRVLYKWIPLLDTTRMKLLKIKNICANATKYVSKNGIEICASIEKTVRKILKTATIPTPTPT